MKHFFIPAILFLASSSIAQADEPVMLFINLNYSSQELAAANRIAKERGEKILVIPPLEDFKLPEKVATPLRNKIDALLKVVAPNEDDAVRENALWSAGQSGDSAFSLLKKISGSPAQIEQLKTAMKQYKEAYSQIVAMEQKEGPITDQIVAQMKTLKDQHQKLDTVIISGHSDGSRIEGETSIKLEDYDLEQLTKDAPEFFQQPKDVLILGCYSNTPMAHDRWKGQSYFHNASLIVGLGARAPLRTNPVSAEYIYSTLHDADALDRKLANHKTVLKASDVLAELRRMAVAPNAAIDYCGYYIDLAPKQSKAGCDEQWMNFQAQYLVVQRNYLDIPVQDPPRAVDNTDLRSFYSFLQSLCLVSQINDPAYRQENQELIQPATDHTIRLIFWWQLQPRYATTYAPQIEKASALLKQSGIDFTAPKIDGNLSRVEFMKTMKALDDKIFAKLNEFTEKNKINLYLENTTGAMSGIEFKENLMNLNTYVANKIKELKGTIPDPTIKADPTQKPDPTKSADLTKKVDPELVKKQIAQLESQRDQLMNLMIAVDDAYGPLKDLDNRIPLGWL